MYGASDKEAEITIPTTELSVDMLRRCIYQDKNVVKLLGLLDSGESINLGDLQLGKVVQENSREVFKPFSSTESLAQIGLDAGDSIWVLKK